MGTNDRVGLVLGGGAALGLAHVGVIRALEEENIRIDAVAGCSMGALVAGLWATGRKADALEKIAREFSHKTGLLKIFDPPLEPGLILLVVSAVAAFLGSGFIAVLSLAVLIVLGLIPSPGLLKGQAVRRWLRHQFGGASFDDAKIPLRMVAFDLAGRKEVLLDKGLLAEAVYKSIAIPGILPPVMEAGQMIVDGGVLNPLPVNLLRDMGISRIIAVDVLQAPAGEGAGMAPSAAASQPDIIVRTLQASQYLFAQESGRQAGVLISPVLKDVQWFELYQTDRLIRAGYDAARRQLPAIRALLEK